MKNKALQFIKKESGILLLLLFLFLACWFGFTALKQNNEFEKARESILQSRKARPNTKQENVREHNRWKWERATSGN